ncbi:MAG TPA: hypothetical protein VJM09_02220 [Sphingobium sp.]|nr:hypothetical protein [Sphingobium sp.]
MIASNISMPQVVRGITLQCSVTGVRRARLRIWLGAKMLKLAAAVIGCAVEVDIKP